MQIYSKGKINIPKKINLNLNNEDNVENFVIVILMIEEYELFKSASAVIASTVSLFIAGIFAYFGTKK